MDRSPRLYNPQVLPAAGFFFLRVGSPLILPPPPRGPADFSSTQRVRVICPGRLFSGSVGLLGGWLGWYTVAMVSGGLAEWISGELVDLVYLASKDPALARQVVGPLGAAIVQAVDPPRQEPTPFVRGWVPGGVFPGTD